MKGIVLAGGAGLRLRPLTAWRNKHLLPIAGRPMIHYPLAKLAEAGIEDVLVVTGREHLEPFHTAIGDGRAFGLRSLTFAGQEGPHGIADALLQGEAFAAGGSVCVLLGDQLFDATLRPHIDAFRNADARGLVLLHPTHEPQRFGIARFEGDDLVEIIEKPERPPGNLAVTGIYCYDAGVFDRCRDLRPSPRGELEITDVNNALLRAGALAWRTLEGWWIDVGTHQSLAAAETKLRR